MTSLTGEYILLGRVMQDTANIFIHFGQGITRTLNITAGSKMEAEWIDGLRFSLETSKDGFANVDVKQPFTSALPAGFKAVGLSLPWLG